MVAIIRAGVGWHLGFRPFDDTYITFRYALNLAQGNGFVYNLNQPVLGTTTPLWTLVLALFSALKLPMAGSALALSLLADGVTALLINSILRRLGYSPVTGGSAAVLFLGFCDYFSLARSGMETAFFVMVIVASLHEIAARRFLPAGLFCGLACITRPEGSILALALLLGLWLHRKSVPRSAALLGLGLLLLCAAGWGLFAILTFGSFIPQSIVAKSFAVQTDPSLARLSRQNLAAFFLEGLPGDGLFQPTYLQFNSAWSLLSVFALLCFAGDCFRCRSAQSVERALILLLFPVCYVGGLAVCHAFTWFPWYYGPIYPFYAMLAAVGASTLMKNLPLSAGQAKAGAAALTGTLLLGQFVAAYFIKMPNGRDFWVQGYADVSKAIPRDAQITVAAFEIGTVGWRVWPTSVLDVGGLVTPQAVGVTSDVFLKSQRPDYIVLTTDNAVDFLGRVSAQPWFLERYELICVVHDPDSDREYHTYRLKQSRNIQRGRGEQ